MQCLIVQTDALNYNNPELYIFVSLTTNIQTNSLLRERIDKEISGLKHDSSVIID